MTEKSYFWGGNSTGDAQNLTSDEYTDVIAFLTEDVNAPSLFSRGVTEIGPENINIQVWANSVVVTPGMAMVDGKLYGNNLGNISFDCSALGFYQLVLRKTFAHLDEKTLERVGQTCRLVMRYTDNTDPGGFYPFVIELYQEDGVIWDIELGRFYQDGSALVNTGIGLDVLPIYYKNTPNIIARQGGSATHWATAGTNKYVCRQSRFELGTVAASVNPQAVTFLKAFAYNPIVIVQPVASWAGNNMCISAISDSGFSVRFDSLPTRFSYWAIGPEN
jgi:hypothetical protein